MAVPETTGALLEDGDEALLTQNVDPNEGVEFADPAGDGLVSDEVISSEEERSRVANEPEAPAKPAPKAKPAPADDGLPEQLRGKTAAEIAAMYLEAQKAIGRQGQELGELRQLADTHIKATLAAQAEARRKAAEPAPKKPIEDADFFANPKAAIEAAIDTHPEVVRLRKENQEVRAAQVKARMAANTQRFNEAHPDAAEILADTEFRAWVAESPVRQQLLTQAHTRYDFVAGNEVFSTWKALKAARAPAKADAADAAAKSRANAKSAARVPTSGNPTSKPGNNGQKIYRRADIIKLQIEDPDRYELLSDEIQKAYQEGRVR